MFIARQPIFNRSMDVYGYELLHRDSDTSISFGGIPDVQATAQVLGGLFEVGIKNVTSNKKAFVNFDYESLLSDSIELMDPNSLIIEVLEDVVIDDILIKRLQELKAKGYRVALDDFAEDYQGYPLVPLSNIIKFDILKTPLDTIRYKVKIALSQGKTILAEKVETEAEYILAKNMGFNLFQGYFFKKPQIIVESPTSKSLKLSHLNILNELNEAEPSYDKLAKTIQSDVNLAYRLFRVVKNKDLEAELDSIREALVIMGLREVERWINILMLQDLSLDKPLELMRLSLIRSKFGESIARKSRLSLKSNEVSTMMLFSTLDALLDRPMEDALEDIPLTGDIKKALIRNKGELAPFLKLVYAYEVGHWNIVDQLGEELALSSDHIYDFYIDSLEYCTKIMNNF